MSSGGVLAMFAWCGDECRANSRSINNNTSFAQGHISPSASRSPSMSMSMSMSPSPTGSRRPSMSTTSWSPYPPSSPSATWDSSFVESTESPGHVALMFLERQQHAIQQTRSRRVSVSSSSSSSNSNSASASGSMCTTACASPCFPTPNHSCGHGHVCWSGCCSTCCSSPCPKGPIGVSLSTFSLKAHHRYRRLAIRRKSSPTNQNNKAAMFLGHALLTHADSPHDTQPEEVVNVGESSVSDAAAGFHLTSWSPSPSDSTGGPCPSPYWFHGGRSMSVDHGSGSGSPCLVRAESGAIPPLIATLAFHPTPLQQVQEAEVETRTPRCTISGDTNQQHHQQQALYSTDPINGLELRVQLPPTTAVRGRGIIHGVARLGARGDVTRRRKSSPTLPSDPSHSFAFAWSLEQANSNQQHRHQQQPPQCPTQPTQQAAALVRHVDMDLISVPEHDDCQGMLQDQVPASNGSPRCLGPLPSSSTPSSCISGSCGDTSLEMSHAQGHLGTRTGTEVLDMVK